MKLFRIKKELDEYYSVELCLNIRIQLIYKSLKYNTSDYCTSSTFYKI